LPRLSPQRRAERHERLRRGFSAAVSYAVEHGARLFLVAGNLFDSPTPSNLERAFVASELARLRRAGVTCVAVSGSHDTPRANAEQGAESPLRLYDALEGLDYFAPGQTLIPRLYAFDDLSVALLGLSGNPAPPPASDPLVGITIEDPGDVLGRADVSLLLAHAGIEGAAPPNGRERVIRQASLKSLPPSVRLVVAGQGRQFSQQRVDERELIATGATERMDFEIPANTSGFVWIELAASGVTCVSHVSVPEQPRADITLETEGLLPVPTPQATMLEPSAPTDELANRETAKMPAGIQRALAKACTPETMVRLRLVGHIARADLRRLAIRDIIRAGQRAFSFDLDTSGLIPIEPDRAPQAMGMASLSPTQEVKLLLAERLASLADPDARELRAAADLLLARLQTREDAR
ncbi:MAG TPA: hypothetical protein VF807_09800, partial [Ktedonobacterales bacterium]